MHFIPATWLELAAANRPMLVYSREIARCDWDGCDGCEVSQ
jgi:hypothetical protein